jgi:gluconate 2-dehydrogenase subunit 3-like protein
MADSSKPMPKEADRRSFLKIGAGVVAGAAVASVAGVAYYDSVIGSNNSSSSSTVASLQGQLAQANSQLSSTQAALGSAQGQVSTLNNQLTATQASLSSANNQLAAANSQLTSVSGQLSSSQASLNSANSQIASLNGTVTNLNTQVTSLNSQVSSATAANAALQGNLDTTSAFLSFSTTEQVEMEAIAEAIIPSDSTGPGAKETGAIYFIDRQLKGTYGMSGLQYRSGPFIPSNVTTAFSVNSPTGVINYPGGSVTYVNGSNNFTVKYNPTANVRVGAGTRFQYAFDMKTFWTIGLAGIQAYANAQYGGNFETLSAANQTACLTDLWSNKPTYDGTGGAITGGPAGSAQEVILGINSPAAGVTGGTHFGPVLPSDFAYELFFMVWNGFWVDPVYGGNKGMLGWKYVGFHGTNLGNFYNEGYTSKALMVATTPITLQPASLGQYQKGSP